MTNCPSSSESRRSKSTTNPPPYGPQDVKPDEVEQRIADMWYVSVGARYMPTSRYWPVVLLNLVLQSNFKSWNNWWIVDWTH